MKTPFEKWLFILSGLLIGAGIGCFILLMPLPSCFSVALLPGERTFFCISGSVCLFAGLLCLHLLRRHSRGCSNQLTHVEFAQTEVQPTSPAFSHEKMVERVPGITSEEELTSIPLWLQHAVQTHCFAGREAIARHILAEWRPFPQPAPETRDMDATRLLPCSVCGLPDQPTLLFICQQCRKFAHEQCCALVRCAQEDGTTLSIDPTCRPYCQPCLEAFQMKGSKLIHDGLGLLLIRPNDFTHDC